jgi:O-antigen ligase
LLRNTQLSDAHLDIIKYFNGHTTTSLGTRFELWRGAIIAFLEYPAFGMGEYAFTERLIELKAAGIINPDIISHAHNDFLDILAKNGGVGLVTLLTIYFTPLYFLAKSKPIDSTHLLCLKSAGVTLIVCYIFFGMSQSFLLHNSGVMIYSFSLAIIWSLVKKITRNK